MAFKHYFLFWHFISLRINMKLVTRLYYKIPWELLFWFFGIIGILLINPFSDHHATICPIGYLGFSWCPGCGLGRAMKLLTIGEWSASFKLHPFAGFAWVVILLRIKSLIKLYKYG
jgi:hypothetical protein